MRLLYEVKQTRQMLANKKRERLAKKTEHTLTPRQTTGRPRAASDCGNRPDPRMDSPSTRGASCAIRQAPSPPPIPRRPSYSASPRPRADSRWLGRHRLDPSLSGSRREDQIDAVQVGSSSRCPRPSLEILPRSPRSSVPRRLSHSNRFLFHRAPTNSLYDSTITSSSSRSSRAIRLINACSLSRVVSSHWKYPPSMVCHE